MLRKVHARAARLFLGKPGFQRGDPWPSSASALFHGPSGPIALTVSNSSRLTKSMPAIASRSRSRALFARFAGVMPAIVPAALLASLTKVGDDRVLALHFFFFGGRLPPQKCKAPLPRSSAALLLAYRSR